MDGPAVPGVPESSETPARQDGSTGGPRELLPSEPFPYLSGLSAQRVSTLLMLRIAPAVTAAAIASTRVDTWFEALLVLVCMLAVSALLRRPNYPMHLIPFASATLYMLAPPLGGALALAISSIDGYTVSQLTVGDLIAPVLGAWIVTALGAWLDASFRRDREVRVAVIGARSLARGLEAELDAVGVPGYRVLGYVQPILSQEAGDRSEECLGTLSGLRETVLDHGIELLVLGPLGSDRGGSTNGATSLEARAVEAPDGSRVVSRLEVFERVADACLDLPVSMIEAGQLYEELFGHVPLGTTTSAWFQYLLHPRYNAGWPLSKRLLDLGLGTVAALISLPILLVAAIAIKLGDRGPIFHRQVRLGEGGRGIEMIKLRTMRVDAETTGAPQWSADEDDRVTAVGRVLRRLHIDELPQLWLVFKGEMSLVGPRPERPSIVEELESRFSYYDRRHLVKPGITGWAQVRCGYGGSHIGTAWKLCHDLYYLKRRSLLFDVLIMLETLSTIVVPEPIKRPDESFIVALRAGGELPAGEI